MSTWFLKRIAGLFPTMLGLLTVVFLAVRIVPGDPAEVILGDYATAEAIQEVRQALGLDEPLYVQYARYLKRLALGDLGTSLRTRQPVLTDVRRYIPHTLILAVAAVGFSVLVGVPFGMVAALRHNTWVDHLLTVCSLAGVSAPVFWVGIVLIWMLSLRFPLFPMIGAGEPGRPIEYLRHLVLPAITLGLPSSALVFRLTRSCVIGLLHEDYVRTARAKGLSESAVILKHVLKNSAIPVVTVVGLSLGTFLGGAVITETVFARPGIGKLLADGIFERDYPLIQGTVIVFAVLLVLVNVAVDVVYGWLDPRIRYE